VVVTAMSLATDGDLVLGLAVGGTILTVGLILVGAGVKRFRARRV
jgi:hypothetical protein